MIQASLEETLRLVRAFRVIQSEESRRNIIFIAEAAAGGADVKQEPEPLEGKPN
jgi:hypothetical protein